MENPYSSPKTQSTTPAPNPNDECPLVRIAYMATLWFVIQGVAYSALDLFAALAVDANTVRFNTVIAAWGTVGLITRGRVESILIPMLALSGLIFAALTQGGGSFELLKGLGAVGASRLGNRLATGNTDLSWFALIARRNAEHSIGPPTRNAVAPSIIGAVVGIVVFCVTLLPFGVWMTLGEGVLLYAAIGSFGSCSRNLPLTSLCLVVICGARFGLSIDTSIYAGVAWLAMLAGYAGAEILRSRERPSHTSRPA